MNILGYLKNTLKKQCVQIFLLYQFWLNISSLSMIDSSIQQLSIIVKCVFNGQKIVQLKVVQITGCFKYTTCPQIEVIQKIILGKCTTWYPTTMVGTYEFEGDILILFYLRQFNVSFYLFNPKMMFYFIFLLSHVAIIDFI